MSMDLLDRLLRHDVWTTKQLLHLCRTVDDADLDREFDIGLRTLRKTLVHVIRNMQVWSELMAGMEPTSFPEPAPEDWVGTMEKRLEAAARQLESVAKNVARREAWDDTWVDSLDSPPTEKTYGGAIAHVITHSMHHRAQILYMLRQLGFEELPEGDVLTWEQQHG